LRLAVPRPRPLARACVIPPLGLARLLHLASVAVAVAAVVAAVVVVGAARSWACSKFRGRLSGGLFVSAA